MCTSPLNQLAMLLCIRVGHPAPHRCCAHPKPSIRGSFAFCVLEEISTIQRWQELKKIGKEDYNYLKHQELFAEVTQDEKKSEVLSQMEDWKAREEWQESLDDKENKVEQLLQVCLRAMEPGPRSQVGCCGTCRGWAVRVCKQTKERQKGLKTPDYRPNMQQLHSGQWRAP